MIKAVLKLMRIKQWVKNAFVLAPLFFSLKFMIPIALKEGLMAFFIFCFTSSIIYVINDIADREKDRLHPKKKFRPIASGIVSVEQGYFLAFCLGVLVICGLLYLGNFKVTLIVGAYILMNVFYSLKLKKIFLIDVMTIAVGFILRVYAGAYAIQVPVSGFIFMTTLFLSLFLGFTKRKAELMGTKEKTRAVLKNYSLQNIDQFILISATLTIVSYALYTLEPTTVERFGSNSLIFSCLFVVYGIFRYISLLFSSASCEDPTENLFQDRGLLITCVGYVIYLMFVFVHII